MSQSLVIINQHIYADKLHGGTLYKRLRCQKKRRKRYGRYDKRGQIPSSKSIHTCPEIVATKERLGDWELDTIKGENHQQAIVLIVERESNLTPLAKVEYNTGETVKAAVIKLLKPLADKVHTITSDDGREFALHEAIVDDLGAVFYFAHPYHSWERGLNENTIGLVRRYFAKGSDFTAITAREVKAVEQKLNKRPRKMLDYQTPNAIFFGSSNVAFRC